MSLTRPARDKAQIAQALIQHDPSAAVDAIAAAINRTCNAVDKLAHALTDLEGELRERINAIENQVAEQIVDDVDPAPESTWRGRLS